MDGDEECSAADGEAVEATVALLVLVPDTRRGDGKRLTRSSKSRLWAEYQGSEGTVPERHVS
jgi:hypothetical protein